jgi:hypothetical protein
VYTYVNGKLRPVEIIPGGKGDKWEWWKGWIQYDIFDIRSFVNITVYPQHNNEKGLKIFQQCTNLWLNVFLLFNMDLNDSQDRPFL